MDLIFESQTKIDLRRVNMKILGERCLCLCDLTNLRLCIGSRGPIGLQLIASARLHVVSRIKDVDAQSQMFKSLRHDCLEAQEHAYFKICVSENLSMLLFVYLCI